MQHIAIKEENVNGKTVYLVSAIPLKNTNKDIVQKIPNPLGSDSLSFTSLEDAKDAVIRAGFAYILPNGEKGYEKQLAKKTPKIENFEYAQFILDILKSKINSTNTNVSASAIAGLVDFPSEETFDILFEKLGEDNEVVRKNAISCICVYPNLVQERIITALKANDWVTRNSALTCIQNIVENNNKVDVEQYIYPLSEVCNDVNTIVQANALTTLSIVYKSYKKQKTT